MGLEASSNEDEPNFVALNGDYRLLLARPFASAPVATQADRPIDGQVTIDTLVQGMPPADSRDAAGVASQFHVEWDLT